MTELLDSHRQTLHVAQTLLQELKTPNVLIISKKEHFTDHFCPTLKEILVTVINPPSQI